MLRQAKQERVFEVPVQPGQRHGLARPVRLNADLKILLTGPEDAALTEFSWGRPDGIGTAAYWVDQARQLPETTDYRLGGNLPEEVVACLLGGYGVKAETALAAFRHLRAQGLVRVDPPPACAEIENALQHPLQVRRGSKPVRYRFPKQRGERIAGALKFIASEAAPEDPLSLRAWLLRVKGIGPKTASWLVRNLTGSGEVAIIDIHLLRAGVHAGFFRPQWKLPNDYSRFEAAFLAYAWVADVSPAALDSCIWGQLQVLGRKGRGLLPTPKEGCTCCSNAPGSGRATA